MLYWNRGTPTGKGVLVHKPLDQSTAPPNLSRGRPLFSEPSEDEELGLLDIESREEEGLRVPDLQPADLSNEGLGVSSTQNTIVSSEVNESDITDLDHYNSADFTADFALESLSNLALRGINRLADVVIAGTPADNEILAYDSPTGDWRNQTPSEADLVENTSSADDEVICVFDGTSGNKIKNPTTMKLRGNFDMNGSPRGFVHGSDNILIITRVIGTVNHLELTTAATGNPVLLEAKSDGTDSNVDFKISPLGTGSLDVDSSRIINVDDPTADQDAATKKYVDDNAYTHPNHSGDVTSSGDGATTIVQLSQMLDVNGQALGDGTLELLKFIEDGSAVNEFTMENQATNSGTPDTGPILSATGDDTHIPLVLTPKGTASILSGVDGTVSRPAYSFLSDTDTGIYYSASGVPRIRFAVSGFDSALLSETGLVLDVDLQLSTGNDLKVVDGDSGFGTNSPVSKVHIDETSTAATRGLTMGQHADITGGAIIRSERSRGTPGSPATVNDADTIMAFQPNPHDGTSYITTGLIAFRVDGTPSTGSVPTAIQFRTGSVSFGTERARITSTGDTLIGTTTYPGGTTGKSIIFGDNGGDVQPGTNTAGLYAKDVSGTVEMFAVDEANNATQISPHDKDGRWVFDSINLKTGRREVVDMDSLVDVVERLSGQKLRRVTQEKTCQG